MNDIRKQWDELIWALDQINSTLIGVCVCLLIVAVCIICTCAWVVCDGG